MVHDHHAGLVGSQDLKKNRMVLHFWVFAYVCFYKRMGCTGFLIHVCEFGEYDKAGCNLCVLGQLLKLLSFQGITSSKG